MKKIVLLLLLVSTALIAQRNPENRQGPNYEKIKALKTAHITEQLELTPSEAETFWPIYNEYDKKLQEVRKKERIEFMEKLKEGGVDSLTDEEAEIVINRMLELRTSEMNYRVELINDLKGVISPQKIIKLQRAEEQFKRKLLKRLRENRGKR